MADEPNQLDEAALGGYLADAIDGFGELTDVKKFSGGQSNPTYLLTTNSGKYVLRAKPPGKLLKSAHQVDREFRVMQALANSNVPVPKMLHLAEDETSPIGRMFFIMEHLEGRIFWDPALQELGDDGNNERATIYDAMNDALAKLHSVKISDVGLSDFGKPGNYYERQLSRWTQQYIASEVDRSDQIHELIAFLEKRLPKDDGLVALVHGDYRLDNMIFASDRVEILGILDWELSTLGHPYADLAYQCMQWRLPHQGGFRGLGGIDRESIGLPSEADYVASYCNRRGIDGIENWSFYLVFSFFRLAAILQGVYKRSLDGNASNPEKARAYGAAVPILGMMAGEIIKRES